jgi:hypothetical protein
MISYLSHQFTQFYKKNKRPSGRSFFDHFLVGIDYCAESNALKSVERSALLAPKAFSIDSRSASVTVALEEAAIDPLSFPAGFCVACSVLGEVFAGDGAVFFELIKYAAIPMRMMITITDPMRAPFPLLDGIMLSPCGCCGGITFQLNK